MKTGLCGLGFLTVISIVVFLNICGTYDHEHLYYITNLQNQTEPEGKKSGHFGYFDCFEKA